MNDSNPAVLPYRTNGADLTRWLEARARGAATDRPAALGIAAKSLDGTVEAATSLGLVEEESTDLTALGRRFVLAAGADRTRILRAAMFAFAPYGGVLEAVRDRGDEETEVDWIERWWGTHGHGGSQSNRAEAAASLGRLVEHVGLGAYIPGRRGHPTRIRWDRDALRAACPAQAGRAADPPPGGARDAGPGPHPAPDAAPARAGAPAVRSRAPTASPPAAERTGTHPPLGIPTVSAPSPAPVEPEGGTRAAARSPRHSRLVLPLGEGRVAKLSIPAVLTRAEKRRLLSLVELLVEAPEE